MKRIAKILHDVIPFSQDRILGAFQDKNNTKIQIEKNNFLFQLFKKSTRDFSLPKNDRKYSLASL